MTHNRRGTWALGVLLLAACAPSEVAPLAPESPFAAAVGAVSTDLAEVKPGEPWLMYEIGGNIHLTRPDGSNQRLLMQQRVAPGADIRRGDWSPDGSQVAFEVVKDDASVWVVDANGNSPTQVITCEGPPCLQISSPAWSPDGSEMLVIRYDAKPNGTWGNNWLEIVNLDTGDRRRIARTPGDVSMYYPRWSNDGEHVVVEIDRYTDAAQSTLVNTVVAVADVDGPPGQAPRVITDPAINASHPDWHPTEDLIVYNTMDLGTRDTDQPSNIYTMAPDGSNITPLTTGSVDGSLRYTQPTWAPDGSSITLSVARADEGGTLVKTVNPAILDRQGGTPVEIDVRGVEPRLRPLATR